jgi:hypothetical protein
LRGLAEAVVRVGMANVPSSTSETVYTVYTLSSERRRRSVAAFRTGIAVARRRARDEGVAKLSPAARAEHRGPQALRGVSVRLHFRLQFVIGLSHRLRSLAA